MSGPPLVGSLNPVVGSANLYTGQVEWSFLWYKMSTPVCAVMFSLFVISMFLHIFQAVKSRYYFLLYTLGLAAAGEAIGWGFRCWAAEGLRWQAGRGGIWLYPLSACLGQISVLAISPAFSAAANYLILGQLISRLGQRFSRLNVKTYAAVFITGDIISLVIQGVGGGVASSGTTDAEADKGARIIVGGVIVQMVVMTAFSLVLIDFVAHYLRNTSVTQWRPFSCLRRRRSSTPTPSDDEMAKPTQLSPKAEKRAKIMLATIAMSTVLIFIRSLFRTVELLDGWTGKLATDQVLFTVLDGGMILLSSILLNVFHPMFLLRRERPEDLETKSLSTVSSPAQAAKA